VLFAAHEREPIVLKLLYPSGNLKKDTIETILRDAKIPYNVVTCYETIEYPGLGKSLASLNYPPLVMRM